MKEKNLPITGKFFLYFYTMKKTLLILLIGVFASSHAQFKVQIETPGDFAPQTVYFYTLDGSRDVLAGKADKMQNAFTLNYPESYVGMMKAYFPEVNYSVDFVSENKDVKMTLGRNSNGTTQVVYHDLSNQAMDRVRNHERKVESILPVLSQIQAFYQPSEAFYQALEKEQQNLSKALPEIKGHPFVSYYQENQLQFLDESASPKSQLEIQKFLSNTSNYLESSSLLRPILMNYLSMVESSKEQASVDSLLNELNLESPRGQTVLAELIELFDMYGMKDLKDNYLSKANNLKCEINTRLTATIDVNAQTSVGAEFPNYEFQNPTKTTAKSLHDVNAKRKVIIFWSSTCKHCETDLPKFIPYYNRLKSQGVELIGLSLDTDKARYEAKADAYPWINDTELRGWNSSFADTYNVKATPFYYVLDENNKILAKPDYANDVIEFLEIN